jgi:hypothetical protein
MMMRKRKEENEWEEQKKTNGAHFKHIQYAENLRLRVFL